MNDILTVSDALTEGTVNVGIVRFADAQPSGLNAWMDRPVLDGHGRPHTTLGPSVDADELVTF